MGRPSATPEFITTVDYAVNNALDSLTFILYETVTAVHKNRKLLQGDYSKSRPCGTKIAAPGDRI